MFVQSPTVVVDLGGTGTVKSVHAGERHSFVLMEDGAVYAFGRADSSQLGLSAALIEERQTKGKHEGSQFKKAVGVPTEVPGLWVQPWPVCA
ncbi:hypothetical protein DM01DRAFT_1339455 [Hesseltinella vesiculosa]|uniref:RCC1/BLIP-II protein n=1 Tax=Hesseltinella vesiculosa TaxID=101127 RepID=A0A1X2G766_9FUNG|nr:hypothetical protein DM01DRAFT_1339455 [Hesseltinella vesiculosa]